MENSFPSIDLEIKSEQQNHKRSAAERRNVGGLGSGRWPSYISITPSKETTEDYFALDIRQIKRHGLIAPLAEEIPGVARLEWITSGFGAGEGYALRPWFLCPKDGCHRRVAILYTRMPEEGSDPLRVSYTSLDTPLLDAPIWACRMCRELCYLQR